MSSIELTSRQRRYLRGLAHPLRPVVIVGRAGVDDGVVASTEEAIEARELIKVKVLEGCASGRDEVGETLAARVGATVAGATGRIVVLYRPRRKHPTIELP